MTRREFIAGLGGAVAWPVHVRAQRAERRRRLAILWRGNVTEGVVHAQQDALLEEARQARLERGF
jgi:hypothetical protein